MVKLSKFVSYEVYYLTPCFCCPCCGECECEEREEFNWTFATLEEAEAKYRAECGDGLEMGLTCYGIGPRGGKKEIFVPREATGPSV